MKVSQAFLLSSLVLPIWALVPGARELAPRDLNGDSLSEFVSRNTHLIDEALKRRESIQYDGRLPELPEGWPNITAAKTTTRRSAESSEVATRSSGDVAIRDDPGDFARYLFMGLRVYTVVAAPVTWYGLVDSCSQFTEETGNGIQCVFGAITQVIAIVTLVYQGAIWRGQLAQRLTDNGWHVPGINKRDEWVSNMVRDLSEGLKSEVRHIGSWDGEDLGKRDSVPAAPREVFGLKAGNQDYHFTFMGRDAEGKGTFKLGLGDGFDPNDKQRRQNPLTNNNFYFKSGGIDFEVQAVESASFPEWSWGSPTDNLEFQDIYNSVNCYLGGLTSLFLAGENAINFQVYDSFKDETLSAGIMSPFSASQKSAIRQMKLTGGIESNKCGAF